MTREELIALAKKIALEYSLEPALVCAVIEQESNWEPWGIRYEPGFYWLYERVRDLVKGKNQTESHARSISWGLMQIMGETARDFGFSGHLASLCDPQVGIRYGCRKLKHCFDKNSSVQEALLSYNGGSDKTYPTQVLARLGRYKS